MRALIFTIVLLFLTALIHTTPSPPPDDPLAEIAKDPQSLSQLLQWSLANQDLDALHEKAEAVRRGDAPGHRDGLTRGSVHRHRLELREDQGRALPIRLQAEAGAPPAIVDEAPALVLVEIGHVAIAATLATGGLFCPFGQRDRFGRKIVFIWPTVRIVRPQRDLGRVSGLRARRHADRHQPPAGPRHLHQIARGDGRRTSNRTVTGYGFFGSWTSK